MKKLLTISAILLLAGFASASVSSGMGQIKWNSGAAFTRDATTYGTKDTSDFFTFPTMNGQVVVTFSVRTAGADVADNDSIFAILYGIHLCSGTAYYERLDTIRAAGYADGGDDSTPYERTYLDTCWGYYRYTSTVRWDTSATATDTMRSVIKIGGNGWGTRFRAFAIIGSFVGDTLDDSLYIEYKYEVRTGEDIIPWMITGAFLPEVYESSEFLAYLGRGFKDALRA